MGNTEGGVWWWVFMGFKFRFGLLTIFFEMSCVGH